MLSILLVVSLSALPPWHPCNGGDGAGRDVRDFRDARSCPGGNSTGTALLSLLPASGAGVGTVADLCDAYSDQLVGNYLCLRGDGTQASAPAMTLSAVGTPTTSSVRTCPNGLDCDAEPELQINGATNRYTTGNVASPSGDFSACSVFKYDSNSGGPLFIGKAGTGGNSWEFWADGGLVLHVFGTGTQNPQATVSLVTGRWYFACVTYDYVGAGTSVAKFYLDGSQIGSTNSTVAGPPAALPGVPTSVGARNGGAQPFNGQMRNILLTEKVLEPSTVAAMGASVTARLTGSRGEAVTITRAASTTCTASDGSSYTIPANTQCVSGGSLKHSVATVVRLNNPVTGNPSRWCMCLDDNTPGHRNYGQTVMFQMGPYGSTNSATLLVDANRNLVARVYTSTGAVDAQASNWGAWTGPRNFGMCVTSSGLPELYGDGQLLGLTVNVSTGLGGAYTQPTYLYVGNDGVGAGNFQFTGPLADVRVVTRASLCTGTPAARAGGSTIRAAMVGDSNTQGFGVSVSFPEKAEQLMDSTAKLTWNYGIGGTTTAQMLTRWRSYIRGKDFTHLVLMGGTNDVLFHGVTADAAWANLQTLLDEARSDGLMVVPVTIIPQKNALGWTAGIQTQVEALNSSIRNYCTANGLTCVDAYEALNDTTDPAIITPAYDAGDHLHLNQAGADALATLVEAVIDP